MKIFCTISFLLFAGILNSFAQNPIPNASFETWTTYTGSCSAPNQYPTGWQTSDSVFCGISSGFAGHSAVQDIDHCASGSYSLKLVTVTAFSLLGPGVATNGKITGISSVSGGSPDTARSSDFTGCYKYIPAGAGDTAIISAYLFKWNSTSVKRDTVAVATKLQITPQNTLTTFTIPFQYYLPSYPDTILIILTSSLAFGHGVPGSALTVDNLNVTGFVGIEENSVIKNVNVYPSPASNELNIDVTYKALKKTYFNLFDGIGKNVLSGEMKNNQQKINITSLSNGIYILSLTGEAGEKLYSTKVTVTH